MVVSAAATAAAAWNADGLWAMKSMKGCVMAVLCKSQTWTRL